MLADVRLVQGRLPEAEQILEHGQKMARTAPEHFQAVLWVRQARIRRIRGDLANALERLDRATSALETEMLLPERVVWHVEQFMVARLQGDSERADSHLTELNRRVTSAGMVVPPWEVERIRGQEGELPSPPGRPEPQQSRRVSTRSRRA